MTEAVKSDAILARLLALHPKSIDLSLDRLNRLLDRLGRPERALPPVIHVAGTNGKGSVCAFLRAGLAAEGKSAHVYSSPHLARFHERIRVAGSLIDEDALADLLEECEAANAGAPITFFEITTAAAFLAFSRTPAAYTILEVGLGGRLDATNVVDPRLCVITSVSIDHQQYLGETLREIAGEKAGILKPGVPAIIGRQPPEALAAIEARAAEVGAPLEIYGQDFSAFEEHERLVFQEEGALFDLPRPILPGRHQFDNAAVALAALRRLGHDSPMALTSALERAEWPARMQRLKAGPLVEILPTGAELWLDGGHNPAAGAALGEVLADMNDRAPAPLYLICGMLNTKDVVGYLRAFEGLARRLYAVAIPGESATLSAAETAAAAREARLSAEEAPTLGAAVEAVRAQADPATPPRILICGSLYLAGRVLRDHG